MEKQNAFPISYLRTWKAADQQKLKAAFLVPSPLWRESSDESEKAGLLTPRSPYLPTLPVFSYSGFKGFRHSLQRRYRTGFTPVSLFSPDLNQGHFFTTVPLMWQYAEVIFFYHKLSNGSDILNEALEGPKVKLQFP